MPACAVSHSTCPTRLECDTAQAGVSCAHTGPSKEANKTKHRQSELNDFIFDNSTGARRQWNQAFRLVEGWSKTSPSKSSVYEKTWDTNRLLAGSLHVLSAEQTYQRRYPRCPMLAS